MESLLWVLGVGLSVAIVHFKTRQSILLANVSFCLVMFISCLIQDALCLAYINLIAICWIVACLFQKTGRFLNKPKNVLVSIAILGAIVFPLIYQSAVDLIVLMAFSMGRFAETLKSPQNMRWAYLICQVSWISYAILQSLELQFMTGLIASLSIVWGIYSENLRQSVRAKSESGHSTRMKRSEPALSYMVILSRWTQTRLHHALSLRGFQRRSI